ncbi:MAG: YebC/PmpR family DNA-binding transcriptional regulator [Patescibacteria group bacterium]
MAQSGFLLPLEVFLQTDKIEIRAVFKYHARVKLFGDFDMSGHSKWATTKRKKAVIDAKRGKIFTKLGKLITIAARDGGGDPASNPTLRMAVDNAKAASMPKENIERAIQRGSGGGDAAAIEEVVYEVYGSGGAGLLVECLTDNKNRTVADIKAILNRNGGSLAGPGSVNYQFKKVGEIIVDETKNNLKDEELEEAIIDSGAEDFEKDDSMYYIYTNFSDLNNVKTSLESAKIVLESAEPSMKPNTSIDIAEDKKESLMKLMDALDDLDDVSKIYINVNL